MCLGLRENMWQKRDTNPELLYLDPVILSHMSLKVYYQWIKSNPPTLTLYFFPLPPSSIPYSVSCFAKNTKLNNYSPLFLTEGYKAASGLPIHALVALSFVSSATKMWKSIARPDLLFPSSGTWALYMCFIWM